jgi:uncharacterized protein (DUF4415 family)
MSKKLSGKVWDKARAKARRALAEMTDEEDARLTAAALADPDSPYLGDRPSSQMRPAAEVMPELVARYRGQRGPQKVRPVKKQVTLRIDPDVLEHYKRLGPGWMARMNDVLRKGAGLKKRA